MIRECAGCGWPNDERSFGCHNCESRHHMRRTLARRRGETPPVMPSPIERNVQLRIVRHDDIPLPPLRFRALVAGEIAQANERVSELVRDYRRRTRRRVAA